MELAMKACLRARGTSVTDVRKYNHDLCKLAVAVQHGKPLLKQTEEMWLSLFNQEYEGKYLVYIEAGSYVAAPHDQIIRIAGLFLGCMLDEVELARGFLRPSHPSHELARPHLPDAWKGYEWQPPL